jgi:cytochrome oxidase Cu insertion factor (SCO1/SenC/PrrC family)
MDLVVNLEMPVRRTGLLCALMAAIVAAIVVAVSAQTVQKIDVSKLGPQVGATVPDFTLSDQQGRKRTLQSIMGPKGAMIVFFRSADW